MNTTEPEFKAPALPGLDEAARARAAALLTPDGRSLDWSRIQAALGDAPDLAAL